jgi:hypothetical protein
MSEWENPQQYSAEKDLFLTVYYPELEITNFDLILNDKLSINKSGTGLFVIISPSDNQDKNKYYVGTSNLLKKGYASKVYKERDDFFSGTIIVFTSPNRFVSIDEWEWLKNLFYNYFSESNAAFECTKAKNDNVVFANVKRQSELLEVFHYMLETFDMLGYPLPTPLESVIDLDSANVKQVLVTDQQTYDIGGILEVTLNTKANLAKPYFSLSLKSKNTKLEIAKLFIPLHSEDIKVFTTEKEIEKQVSNEENDNPRK